MLYCTVTVFGIKPVGQRRESTERGFVRWLSDCEWSQRLRGVQWEVGHRVPVVEFQEWKLSWSSERGIDCRGDRAFFIAWRLRRGGSRVCVRPSEAEEVRLECASTFNRAGNGL